MFMSIMRANYAAFPISPRNSPAAVAHLINKVGAKHVLVGREQSMHDLADSTLEILRTQYFSCPAPELSPLPLFEELYLPPSEVSVTKDDVPYEYKGPDAVIEYLHSSGDYYDTVSIHFYLTCVEQDRRHSRSRFQSPTIALFRSAAFLGSENVI